MPLLTFTYKNTSYGIASKLNNRFLFFRDGEYLVKKLTKICEQFVLVPEVGESGNFHWHASARVKDRVGLGKLIGNWNKKHGFTKISRDDVQARPRVSFIKPEMEAKLNVHLYLRKSTNETYRQMGFKAEAIPPKIRMISKTTKKWFRMLKLEHDDPYCAKIFTNKKITKDISAFSDWFCPLS